MMGIETYKKKPESMSREELLNEISNLISDHGIQLQDKCNEIQELKSALAREDLQLQSQIGEVALKDNEIESLKGKRKPKDKLEVEYSPFLMLENYDLYLRSMSKEELIEYFYFVTDNYRNSCDKSALENIELEKQVNCLKQELEEKNTYEEKLNSMIDNLRDDISEQKAEIERLKEEKKTLVWLNQDLEKQVNGLKSALADTIQRNEELIEENEQSVKGTVNEICILLRGFGIDAMLEAIRETYGIEV